LLLFHESCLLFPVIMFITLPWSTVLCRGSNLIAASDALACRPSFRLQEFIPRSINIHQSRVSLFLGKKTGRNKLEWINESLFFVICRDIPFQNCFNKPLNKPVQCSPPRNALHWVCHPSCAHLGKLQNREFLRKGSKIHNDSIWQLDTVSVYVYVYVYIIMTYIHLTWWSKKSWSSKSILVGGFNPFEKY